MGLVTGSLDGIECSVHTLPKPLMREFCHVFADKYLSAECLSQDGLEILAIPTNQHAIEDLVAVGDHIEREKDRLLNVVSQRYFLACGWRVLDAALNSPLFASTAHTTHSTQPTTSLLPLVETCVLKFEGGDIGPILLTPVPVYRC